MGAGSIIPEIADKDKAGVRTWMLGIIVVFTILLMILVLT